MEHIKKARIYRSRWERLIRVQPQTKRLQKIIHEVEIRGLTFCLIEMVMKNRIN